MKIFRNQYRTAETIDGPQYSMDIIMDNVDTKLSSKQIILILILYFFGYNFAIPYVLSFIVYSVAEINETLAFSHTFQLGLQLFISLLLLVAIVLLALPLLKESYYAIRKNKLYLLKTSALLYPLLLMGTFVASLFVALFAGTGSSNNQDAVVSVLAQAPLFGFYYTVVFAPLVEEIVFRGTLFRPLRTKYGFIVAALVSSFIFGFMHVAASLGSGDFLDLLNIIIYATISFFLCLAYEVTGSIYSSVLLHFFNNIVSVLIIIFGMLM